MTEPGFIAIDDALVTATSRQHGDYFVRLKVTEQTWEAVRAAGVRHVELALRPAERQGSVPADVRLDAADVPAGPFAEYVWAIIRFGAFRQLDVLRALGSDAEYQSYCRRLPCEITGEYAETLHGDGRSVYAHVSDASRPPAGSKGAGSKKPIYSGLPMQQWLHEKQHSQGWKYVYHYYCQLRDVAPDVAAERLTHRYRSALNWARRLRDYRIAQWAQQTLAARLEVSMLSDASPQQILAWAHDNGVGEYFPQGLDKSILAGSATHALVTQLHTQGKAPTEIAKAAGWQAYSYAIRNVINEQWQQCENPDCGQLFAPPTPIGKPYTRRFCSAECVEQSGHRNPYTAPGSPPMDDAARRFLYG